MPTIHTPKTDLAKTASDRAVALMKQISDLPLDRDTKRSLMMKVQTLASVIQSFDDDENDLIDSLSEIAKKGESAKRTSEKDAALGNGKAWMALSYAVSVSKLELTKRGIVSP